MINIDIQGVMILVKTLVLNKNNKYEIYILIYFLSINIYSQNNSEIHKYENFVVLADYLYLKWEFVDASVGFNDLDLFRTVIVVKFIVLDSYEVCLTLGMS